MLAKIGSDMNKPDGHFILPSDPEEIEKFMADLNIRKIPGIGPVAESELNELDIFKSKDFLENLPEVILN